MDLRSLEAAFSSLDSSSASADEFRVLELPAPATARVAVDPSGRRHILFPVAAEYAVHPDTKSAGVQILGRELIVEGWSQRFADLACLDASLNALFTAVAAEALAAADGATAPDDRAARVLDRWRDLFRNPPKGGLSQSERLGLFGELQFLGDLSRGSTLAVKAWAGPSRGRHDFVSQRIDFEVKTTLDRATESVQVHGLDQLAPPPQGLLYLVLYIVERVPVGGETLGDVVSRLCESGIEATALYDRLNTAGVGAADLEDDLVRLRVLARRIYPVTDAFPRLGAESFVSWPVPGVVGIQYGVDLSLAPAPLSGDASAALLGDFAAEIAE